MVKSEAWKTAPIKRAEEVSCNVKSVTRVGVLRNVLEVTSRIKKCSYFFNFGICGMSNMVVKNKTKPKHNSKDSVEPGGKQGTQGYQ